MRVRTAQSAFTLLELAVVLALVGLMAAFGVEASNGLKDVQCNGETAEQLARIQTAVQGFVASNGRLPKPALVTLGSSNGEFGKEVTTLPNADLVDTGNVLIGSLPHVTLGLPIEMAADCWGNKFTYAVTEALTSNDPATGYGPSAGAITLKSGTRAAAQDLMTTGAYVVVSHGSDRLGATPLSASTIVPRWCTLAGGTEIDRENCDTTNDVYFDGYANPGTVADNAYDDILVFEGKDPVATAVASNAYGWGYNLGGGIGDGTETTQLLPTAALGDFDFVSITAGRQLSCGLTDAGAAYCWGANNTGEVGDGTTTSRLVPTEVGGSLVFKQLDAGGSTVCGLTGTGAAYCWGFNGDGQVGDGTTVQRSSPVLVSGGLTFRQISTGEQHTCAITNLGAAYCWGTNPNYQIGDGSNNDRYIPTAVGGALTFRQVAAGSNHTCGIASNNKTYCWGSNFNRGAVGDGTGNNYRSAPTEVTGGLTFTKISAGGAWNGLAGNGTGHTCGLTQTGSAYCWGFNDEGRLGDGTVAHRLVPTAVSGGLSFVDIAIGRDHTCALTRTGQAYCWGDNYHGRLGDGTQTDRYTPTPVAGGQTYADIDAGWEHSIAITGKPGGSSYGWANNTDGKIGDGTSGADRLVPTQTIGGLTFSVVDAGTNSSCGLLAATGAAYCWGKNNLGQLGDGTTTNRLSPTPVATGLTFNQISVGNTHTCALSGMDIYCWGEGYYGTLGNGGTANSSTPRLVAGGLLFKQVSSAFYSSCGLTQTNDAYCWGNNGSGQLGTGNNTDSLVPVAVVGGLKFVQITTGSNTSCGLTLTGSTHCWGLGTVGQLGNGASANSTTPVLVKAGASSDVFFDFVSAGSTHVCGITPAKVAYCWGRGQVGQLGTGVGTPTLNWATPVAGGLSFARIDANGNSSCGLTLGGDAYCWGDGPLGNGVDNDRNVPTLVSGGLKFGEIAVGGISGSLSHIMAVTGTPD